MASFEHSRVSRAAPPPYTLVYEPAGAAPDEWRQIEAATWDHALAVARDLRAHGAGFIAVYERLGLCREELRDGTGCSRWSWTDHLISDEL